MGWLAMLPGVQQRGDGRASGPLLAGRAPVRVVIPCGEHKLQHPHHHGGWEMGR